ncbi:MAG: hypothetical protein M3463_10485, partial [Verrucomicrobiota bacterium]|nr:hypothetical protein [Verrucomicrobiota bacterium]
MPANPNKLFADVLDAGRAIQRHCGGRTRDKYLADEVLPGFVERKLLVIGEALWRLREQHPDAAPALRASTGSSASGTGSFTAMMPWMIFPSGTPFRLTCLRCSPKWKNCWAGKLERSAEPSETSRQYLVQ